MWDLKLIIISFFLFINSFLSNTLIFIFDLFNPCIYDDFIILNIKTAYWFPLNMTLIFSIKLSLFLFLLILIRGGTPRYRYDYLTKLGWLKFLGLIILVFSISILFLFLF